MSTIVEARGLALRYTDAGRPTLREISGTLRRGERVLLLGPSGSGKSSLALCLNGIIPHSIAAEVGGELRVFGDDPRRSAVAWIARRVGMVFQNPSSQFCTLTVADEVAFGLENLAVPPEAIGPRIDRALAQVGWARPRDAALSHLSGGEQQRVAIAAALAMEPELLVLDEVTANLDPAGAAQVLAAIAALARRSPERTLLLIAHQIDPLLRMINRVWVLDGAGRLAYDGPPRQVFTIHGADIAAAGIWLPSACALALALGREGLALDPAPLRLGEAMAQVRARPALRPAVERWARPGSGPPPPPGAPPAIELESVSFSYPGGSQVLDRVSLRVQQGEILALLGANGCGKTTLAQLVVGLLRPKQGTVRVLGRDVARWPARELARRCGLVFQNPEHQFVTDRVFDEVAFGLRRQGRPEPEVARQVAALLDRFRLAEQSAAHPYLLSEGQKRRLSVATMLVDGTAALVLDEPTFGQDAHTTAELIAELRQLNHAGVTLLIITHDMDLVWELAHRAAVLERGRLLAAGPVVDLLCDTALLRRARLALPRRAAVAAALARMH